MKYSPLFKPYKLSEQLRLKNRIVMAPMNRSMADDKFVPTEAMMNYYARRADTGLIISESLMISPNAQGYPNTPAIYAPEHIAGWKKVTDKVHDNGGKIFAQLWHTGRVSHPIYLNGQQPWAPSAVPLEGRVPRTDNLQYGTPKEMTEQEIELIVTEFANAAANAKEAGFDGVELHAANGYLLDQFLHWDTNRRTDAWGGSAENMSQILFNVIDAVKQNIEHVGVRISPVAYLNLEHDERDILVSNHLLQRLNDCNLSYVHTGMFEDTYQAQLQGSVTQYIKSLYHGTIIACGGYSAENGSMTISQGDANLVAIGRPLIANPDYVEKIRTKKPLTVYDAEMLNQLI
ncbi:alkene reductase [Shewanella schlegeliana]|uniref:Alkene reductase n=1 Tax=Shewanella schlegeliana TaxID=190308 RepID=A0ABS1SV88_9GAMM|nr:alkene reductase [Shewanella schlegeliana]MBL4912309.1 alkene reductase [Shewanella schlegeliana]MCL1108222.1 alkene reductase [Shewanella schlegeliana]GIU22248.1 alkene reductase [Shewanella schlegeliana]